ncbi:MAG: hypothetical protein ACIPMY_04230 [Rickettsia endosymbiont of Pentastiridius leporinus]
MHNIFSSFSTSNSNNKLNINNSDNSSVIFYNFVGNFIPPEWSTLSSHLATVPFSMVQGTEISY